MPTRAGPLPLLLGALALALGLLPAPDAVHSALSPALEAPVHGVVAPIALRRNKKRKGGSGATQPAQPPPGPTNEGARPAPAPSTGASPSTAGFRTSAFDPATFKLGLVPVLSGLSQPVFVTSAGDGSNRLFVVERAGRIRVAVNGQLQSTPFLDIRSIVTSSGLEQGLLGLAFHPSYASNGRFFVYYTSTTTSPTGSTSVGDNTLARYQVSSGNPNVADLASAKTLFAIPDKYLNHNGGMLAFGPDHYLYVGLGDGGSGGDPDGNGQNRNVLLAKLLRLDVDTGSGVAPYYSVPPTNPFVGQANVKQEIWAYGLRNPWRFSFDRGTNDLYIADVGQNLYEEIDRQAAGSSGGQDYGWNIMEGFHCYPPTVTSCSQAGLMLPIAEYGHTSGNCSITGGYVYRGPSAPALAGVYLYGDYCSGRIWALQNGVQTELLDTTLGISSFGEDEAGDVYVVDLGSTSANTGAVYRLVDASCSPRPNVLLSTVATGSSLQVTVTASTSAALPSNSLQRLSFGSATNALIDAGSVVGSSGNFTVNLPAGTQQTGFTVRRATPGQPTTVPFVVVDACGDWSTFVGGGANAGF